MAAVNRPPAIVVFQPVHAELLYRSGERTRPRAKERPTEVGQDRQITSAVTETAPCESQVSGISVSGQLEIRCVMFRTTQDEPLIL